MTTTLKRVAIVLSGLGVLAALLFTFIPAGGSQYECGTWVNPEWDREEAKEMALKFADIAEKSGALGADLGAEEQAYYVANSWKHCDEALSSRRGLTFGALGFAVLAPAAVWFIGRDRRKLPSESAESTDSSTDSEVH